MRERCTDALSLAQSRVMGAAPAKSDVEERYRDAVAAWLRFVSQDSERPLNQSQLGELLSVGRTVANKYLAAKVKRPEYQNLQLLAGKHSVAIPREITELHFQLRGETPSVAKMLADAEPPTPKPRRRRDAESSPEHSAPIVGQVGAGAIIEAVQDDDPKQVPIPGGFEDASAYRVVGDSCWPVFEDGDVLVVRGSQRADPAEFLNRFCVVETKEGEGYVKRVVPGASAGPRARLYNLESPNAPTIENRAIESARPVLLRLLRGGR